MGIGPLVSVIIPVYNKANYVLRAIQSVINQTYSNIEVIVVDDGSTDDSAKRVAESDLNNLIKYVYQENAGVAIARNNGVFNHSTGDAILCLDADDAIGPRYLELLVPELFGDRTLGVVYTKLLRIKKGEKPSISPWPDKFDAEKHFFGRVNQVPTAALAKRIVWTRLGGQRQRYAPYGAGAEDGDFWLRAASYGFGIEYIHPQFGVDSMFHYSAGVGAVSENRQYHEVPFRNWSQWTKNRGLMPTPSIAKPVRFSHPARQYDEPVVSVIIPVGPRHVKYLVDSLDSLDAQIFKKWEAIVVFDIDEVEWEDLGKSGELDFVSTTWPFCRFTSTHAGGMLARELVDTLDVIAGDASLLASLPAGPPMGAGAARNAGIRLARGPLLIFLDADDYLMPEALNKMISAYRMQKKIIFSEHYGIAPIAKEDLNRVDGKVVDYNEKTGHAVIHQRVKDYNCREANEQPYRDGRTPYVICNVSSLIPRRWAELLGGFSEELPSWEDVIFWWMASWKGYCFHRVAEPLLVYRYHTGERRETGRKMAKWLLDYAEDVHKRIGDMGCGCKQDANSSNTIISTYGASAEGVEMGTLRLSRGNQLQITDGDVELVTFNPMSRGDMLRHGVHDFGGGNFVVYGRLSGGEQIFAHKLDIEADEKVAQAQGREPQFVPVIQIDSIDIAVEDEDEDVYDDMPPELIEALSTEPPIDELAIEEVLDEAFPDPVVDFPPRLTPIEDLDVGDLRNPDKYVKILKEYGINTAWDVIQHEDQTSEGLSSLMGIGPKARESFVNAARPLVNS